VNSLEETRLAEDLRRIAADPPAGLDLDQIERRGTQRRRRGHAIRGLAALAGLALIAATGLAVAGPGRGPQSQAPAATVAYVTQRIAAALNVSNFVVETEESGSGGAGPIYIWTDLRTGDTMSRQGRGTARIAYWLHEYFDRRQQVLHWDLTHVSYGPRTWWSWEGHVAKPPHGGVSFDGPGQVSIIAPQVIAALVKHSATIIGHPYVDGHRTVELSAWAGAGPKTLVWADTGTYQVVRVAQEFPAQMHAKPLVADLTWIRRTAALVQQISHPQIPAGFRQVPGIR
jgi:hypothetical protein